MADVSISQLNQIPSSGNHLLPYSDGSNTLSTPVSALFQLASHKLGIGTGSTPHLDLSKLEVEGPGDVVSSTFNVRSWARFKADNSVTNYSIMFDTGAPPTLTSVRGLVFSYKNPAMGVVRFDANKTAGYTTDIAISSGGNVSIGGQGLGYNPVHRLEVDGTIKAAAISLTAFNKAILSDVKAVATPGGDATRDFWNKRTLNTKTDPNNIVTLSNDVFTLGAGKYVVNASAPAYRTHEHQIRLYRVGAAAGVVQYGTTEFSNYGGGYAQTRSFLCCLMDITENTSYQIEHWVNYRSGATETLGITNIVSSGAPSIFTTVEITKI